MIHPVARPQGDDRLSRLVRRRQVPGEKAAWQAQVLAAGDAQAQADSARSSDATQAESRITESSR